MPGRYPVNGQQSKVNGQKSTAMFQLKPISKAGIPEALQKAERYRLLNEPHLAESICQDILDLEPENHKAVITKLLAITDQFGKNTATNANNARQLLPM